MSFSFHVTATTLAALAVAASAKMSEIVAQQPAHERDEATVNDAIARQIALLSESDEHNFALSVGGSIGVVDDGVSFANVSVSVSRTDAAPS